MVKPPKVRPVTTCPYCSVTVAVVNLRKHWKKVHGLGKKFDTSSSGLFENYQTVKPTPSPEASLKLAQEPNAVLKRELERRHNELKLGQYVHKQSGGKIKTTHCATCGIIIAARLLRIHEREMHEWKPATSYSRPVSPSRRQNKSPPPPAVEPLPSREATAFIPNQRQAICPRCGGDGGVRGGCGKCDGTGWVPEEMERDVFYNNRKQAGGDESKISNSDYIGNNLGGHFRDHDGRIGSIPLHDDYSEESD